MKRGNLVSPEGLWLVNKPLGKSSFWCVSVLRRVTGIRKIGHAGTLDPLAEGLMLVLVGKDYTRQADSLLKQDKDYELVIRLGMESTTDDEEGEKRTISDRQPTLDELQTAIKQLTGGIEQVPPSHSAIKVAGRRAYTLARRGEAVQLAARTVTVYKWTEVHYRYPELRARVRVSSGTYIRSLARDIGKLLGTGAYLTALKRTQIGEYHLDAAVDLTALEKGAKT